MIASQRAHGLVQPINYQGAWGGQAGPGPRIPPQGSPYNKSVTAPPERLPIQQYQPQIMEASEHFVEQAPVFKGTQKSKHEMIRGSPSYHGPAKPGAKAKPDPKKKSPFEVISTSTMQWFPQTKQYYYGQPTPTRPIHMHYHLPAAAGWLETYQQPQNMGDAVLGVRWGERNNDDFDMRVVGWVWKWFELDGYAMQMWRNKEEQLIGRDLNSGMHPILFWDLRRLREVQLHPRGARQGPILNLYFKDGGVQLRTDSYDSAMMWRSACQNIILEMAEQEGDSEKHDRSRGRNLLKHMAGHGDTWSDENLSHLWDAYEKNRDGVLKVDEVKSLVKEIVHQQREQAMHDIHNPSARDEKVKELTEMEQKIDDDYAKGVMKQFDVEHDGRINKTEFMNQAPKIFAGFGQSKPQGYRSAIY